MRLLVRRIVMEPQTGRGDKRYVLFEETKLDRPMAILNETEAAELLGQLQFQLFDSDK